MCHHVRGDLSHVLCVRCTGEGGNNLLGNKKQIGNQELQRGNAALVRFLTPRSLSPIICNTDTGRAIRVHSAAQVCAALLIAMLEGACLAGIHRRTGHLDASQAFLQSQIRI